MPDWGWLLVAAVGAYLLWRFIDVTVRSFWHGFGPHWPAISADLAGSWHELRRARRAKRMLKKTVAQKMREAHRD